MCLLGSAYCHPLPAADSVLVQGGGGGNGVVGWPNFLGRVFIAPQATRRQQPPEKFALSRAIGLEYMGSSH
jgi:hypothetical protein